MAYSKVLSSYKELDKKKNVIKQRIVNNVAVTLNKELCKKIEHIRDQIQKNSSGRITNLFILHSLPKNSGRIAVV